MIVHVLVFIYLLCVYTHAKSFTVTVKNHKIV